MDERIAKANELQADFRKYSIKQRTALHEASNALSNAEAYGNRMKEINAELKELLDDFDPAKYNKTVDSPSKAIYEGMEVSKFGAN